MLLGQKVLLVPLVLLVRQVPERLVQPDPQVQKAAQVPLVLPERLVPRVRRELVRRVRLVLPVRLVHQEPQDRKVYRVWLVVSVLLEPRVRLV